MSRLILLFFLLTTLSLHGQNLPNFIGSRIDLTQRKEIAKISYNNNNSYKLDNEITFSSSREIGELLCQKFLNSNIRESEIAGSYISLEIDKNATILVLDSIYNELYAFKILTVKFATNYSESSGIVLRIAPENLEVRATLRKSNKYVPQVLDITLCKNKGKKSDNVKNRSSENNKIPPPPPPPPVPVINYPIDFIPKLDTDSLLDNRKVFIVSKTDNGFTINGSVYSFEKADIKLKKIISSQNYFIVVEMNNKDSYNDYLSILDLTFRNLYSLRDENPDKQYSLHLLTYSITDKRCQELKNYNC